MRQARDGAPYYAASAGPTRPFPRLVEGIKADICIIGGGFTGLSAALHLGEAGVCVSLVEAETVGFGAAGGQIHTGLRQDRLEKQLGAGRARALWNLTEESKTLVHALVEKHAIDCALKSGLAIAAHNERAARALAAETERLARVYGYSRAQMMGRAATTQKLGTEIYAAARYDEGGGHLQPLSFARGLAGAADKAGATIWEHSPALHIGRSKRGAVVRCSQGGNVTADCVIIACGAYSGSIAPRLARTIGQIRSHVVATAPLGAKLSREILPSDVAVADTRHMLDYYHKSSDGRLIFAGGETPLRAASDVAGLVRPQMLRVFPQLADIPIEFAWSATVGITRTGLPHFGKLSDRVFFAHGYSGQDVSLAVLGGKLLAEAAMGNSERFDVFARLPTKIFPGGAVLRKPLLGLALRAMKRADAA
jgi:gamma-glutamylputrescine oxidase